MRLRVEASRTERRGLGLNGAGISCQLHRDIQQRINVDVSRVLRFERRGTMMQ